MEFPKQSELNCSNCTERSIKIHYPEFHNHLCERYPELSWAEKMYWFYNNITKRPQCVCGCNTKFINFRQGYREFCSYKCTNQNIQERREQSFLNKYGVTNPMKLQTVRDKLVETNIERFGVDNVFKSKSIKNKIKQTDLIRYGATHHMKTTECVSKMIQTRNNAIIKSHPEIISISDEFVYRISCPHSSCALCEEKWYDIPSSIWSDRHRLATEPCTRIMPVGKYTKGTSIELFITHLLDELGVQYETNCKTVIPPKEVDIYIPSHNLAIECNWIYWHSSDMKPNNYHEQKYKTCLQNGVQLLTIWEDWIVNKPEITRSILMSKLGLCERIYARNCVIREVDVKTSNHFLQENHIQGKTPSKVRLGLYYKGKLVSIMLFGARQTMSSKNEEEWDLVRFCNTLGYNVVGGASKLLNYFIKNYHPKSICSFSSNDISTGNLYKKLGFVQSVSNQSYWYIGDSFKRYHRSSFTKDSIVNRGWKTNKEGWTETEVMKEHGYLQIYDSGQTKWILDL